MRKSIEIKRDELQLIKIDAAIAELEFKILELESEVERVIDHIELQKKSKLELTEKLTKEKLNG
jgi:hypothetical protein